MPTSKELMAAALEYVKEGFKVFPVKLDKKPLTEHGLKDATQTTQGVKEYWTKWPDASIGIVTDGFVVLDFDLKSKGLESLKEIEFKYGPLPHTRTHVTGGGGYHYIYRNPNGTNVRNTTQLAGYSGVDIRANGGYIVAPPSPHPSGNDYYFYELSPIADAPSWLVKLATAKESTPASTPGTSAPIPEGTRNATLAKLAGAMRRQGMTAEEIETALIVTNKRCNPPLSENEVRQIAKSVERYQPAKDFKHTDGKAEIDELFSDNKKVAKNDNDGTVDNIFSFNNSLVTPSVKSNRDKPVTESVTKRLSEKIEEWVAQTSGWFSYEECDKENGIRDTKDKDNRRQVFKRLKDAGKIESHPKDNKNFRYINTSVRLIDFKSGDKKAALDIKYPFGIERYFKTYPGNIVVVAGSPDSGKTAFLLNVIRMNMDNFSIFYQSSEMGKDELTNRLENFEGIDLPDWNFTAEERSSNFADVIRPNCVNLIDYLELCGDFYMVAEYLKQIHDKLQDGIAIVALQKDPKANQGRGGMFGLEKPRLYLNMDAGKIVIRKAKNWTQPAFNPNGLRLNFKLVGGCKFITEKDDDGGDYWFREAKDAGD
jgi:putative DNA primase/helicase